MGREIGVKQSREMDLHTGGELGQLEGAGPTHSPCSGKG